MYARKPNRIRNRHGIGRRQPTARAAFTLIELLVVIGLMLLLVGMTVTSVDFAFDSETVTGGARQLQGFLEGARDRAIYAKEIRGVRLLVREDPLNGRTVASAVYIKPQYWSEGIIQLASTTDDATARNLVVGRGTLWGLLRNKNALPQSTNADPFPIRIRIPKEGGRWYAARRAQAADVQTLGVAASEALVLQVPFTSYQPPNSYELELPPTVLSNQSPLLLPAGVVIDLDGSKVPDYWRPAGDTSSVGLAGQYSAQMDIMFSPQGTVVGRSTVAGVIHLCLASQAEIDELNNGLADAGAGVRLVNRPSSGSGNEVLQPPATSFGRNAGDAFALVPTEPLMSTLGGQQGDRLVVTLWTSTGNIAVAPIDPTPLSDFANSGVASNDLINFAANPFRFADGGQEAQP